MKGEYLKDIVDADDFEERGINLIYAPCGAGKTSFIFEKLRVEYPGHSIVFLIDTTKGKKQLLKRSNAIPYTEKEWMNRAPTWEHKVADYDNIIVMTYYQFGLICTQYPGVEKFIDIIICDEMHNLFSFCKWEIAREKDENKKYYDKAYNRIIYMSEMCSAIVIGMTATPNAIYNEIGEWATIHQVYMDGEPFHYEDKQQDVYNNLTMLLNKIQIGQKGLVYVPRITQIQKYMELLRQKGIRTNAIWSEHNEDYKMDKAQQIINDSVINDSIIPDDVDVLFINKSCETSVNIESHLDFIIVHDANLDVQTQVRGRYRNDLDNLYCYDSNVLDDIELPETMLNTKLTKADIDQYIKENDIRGFDRHIMKQPSFLKDLENQGYKIEKKKSGSTRYVLISK